MNREMVERRMFSELVKRGVDQDTADQVAQAVAASLTPLQGDDAELVERLRIIRGTQFTPTENALVTEAADRFAALVAEHDEMREALRLIADESSWRGFSPTQAVERIREHARSILNQQTKDNRDE